MMGQATGAATGAAGPRIALVTGAGRGIGAAIARRLSADGFAVALVDVDTRAVEGAAQALPLAVAFGCDVSDARAVGELRTAVEQQLGPPWLLVNAAGVFFVHRVPDLDEEGWDRTIDVNLKGPFLTCRALLPAMLAAKSGCIINIASTAGLRGGHDRAAYCASKAGLVMFTRSLALDHGADGVRVNCVCPGLIDTPMADWITTRPQALEQWRQGVPAQRIGVPNDIAGVVAFLASPDADYIHGSVLLVDGGVSA
ncbi:MAG: SDR family NAD(P)-dependent oxidoreductase [Candidatus Dormiibacterota bacterium]